MDQFDLKILSQLQVDARRTAEEIGDDIGLSGGAVQKRLKRLRSSGVIKHEVAVLDPRKLDRSMTMIVEVTLDRENQKLLDAFKKKMRDSPRVQQCYYTTGDADFVLIIVVKDIAEYETFTRDYFFGTPEVSKFHTSVVMDPVKIGLSVPIEI